MAYRLRELPHGHTPKRPHYNNRVCHTEEGTKITHRLRAPPLWVIGNLGAAGARWKFV